MVFSNPVKAQPTTSVLVLEVAPGQRGNCAGVASWWVFILFCLLCEIIEVLCLDFCWSGEAEDRFWEDYVYRAQESELVAVAHLNLFPLCGALSSLAFENFRTLNNEVLGIRRKLMSWRASLLSYRSTSGYTFRACCCCTSYMLQITSPHCN